MKTLSLPRALAFLVLGCLAGCIPLPYRPAATLSHVPALADANATVVVSSDCRGWLQSVTEAVKSGEKRVVTVDPASFTQDALHDGKGTLTELMAAPLQTIDYVLIVGWPTQHQLSACGVAMPGMFGVVGYERIKHTEDVFALLVDVRTARSIERLTLHTTYSQLAAGLWWGIKTEPMPLDALRRRLANEVAHLVGTAIPSGPIRLTVLGAPPQDEGDPADAPATSEAALRDRVVTARREDGMVGALREYVHATTYFWDSGTTRCAR